MTSAEVELDAEQLAALEAVREATIELESARGRWSTALLAAKNRRLSLRQIAPAAGVTFQGVAYAVKAAEQRGTSGGAS